MPSEGFFGFAIGFIGFLSENNVKRFFGFSIGLFFLLENNVKICIFFAVFRVKGLRKARTGHEMCRLRVFLVFLLVILFFFLENIVKSA